MTTDLFTYTDDPGPVATTAPLPPDAVSDGSWLHGVDCPVAGECVAVGQYSRTGGQAPFAVHLIDGTWTPTRIPADGRASVDDVACTSPTACVAVGTQDDDGVGGPFLSVWDGESWDQLGWEVPDDLRSVAEMSVDCGAGHCAVAGIYIDAAEQRGWLLGTYAGGGWSLSTQSDPGFLQGLDLSCAGSLDCLAVAGNEGATRVQTLSAGVWTVADLPDLSGEDVHLRSVACPEAAHCVAVGRAGATPVLSRFVSGTWSSTVPAEPFGEAVVACASADHCLSAGTRAVSRSGVTASRAIDYKDYFAELSTIGSDSTSSVDGLLNDTYVDPGLGAWLQNATCSSAGWCGAVGDIPGVCLIATPGSGTVDVSRVTPQPGQGQCLPSAVAADSDTTAVAVGLYGNSGPAFRHGGLIISGVPLVQ